MLYGLIAVMRNRFMQNFKGLKILLLRLVAYILVLEIICLKHSSYHDGKEADIISFR